MIEGMDKIDIYNDSAIILNNTELSRINSWIFILILMLIIFIIFSFIPFKVYNTLIGTLNIDNDKVYFITKLEEKDFPINKKNKLYIRNKEYDYKVISIKDDNLILRIDLDDNMKIQNNTIMVNILKGNMTIVKFLKERIKKGLM